MAAGSNLNDLGRKYVIMNERALSWVCAVGGILVFIALLGVAPILGQASAVDGLARQIDRLEDQQNATETDLGRVHVELAMLRVDLAQIKVRNDQADRYLERSFWGILAILGSILYRTAAAFWALRAGWLKPEPETETTHHVEPHH
jgi:hypothetical protein